MVAAVVAILAAAQAVKTVGQYRAGRAQADALNANADVEGQNAVLILQQGEAAVQNLMLRQESDLSAQVGQFAASGVLISSGSVEASVRNSARNQFRDVESTRFNYDVAAFNARARAASNRATANAAKDKATTGAIAGLINIGSNAKAGGLI